MIDVRSWRKNWSDAALRRLPTLPEGPHSHTWPMLGMLAIGLVAGAALGGYAVSQRSQLKRLAANAHRVGDELVSMVTKEASPAPAITSTPSNHRRKAGAEV